MLHDVVHKAAAAAAAIYLFHSHAYDLLLLTQEC